MRQVACSFKQSIQFYLHSNFTVTNSQRYSVHRWEISTLVWITISVVGEMKKLFLVRHCIFFRTPMQERINTPMVDFICLDACNHLKSAGMNSTLNNLYSQSEAPHPNKYMYILFITRIHGMHGIFSVVYHCEFLIKAVRPNPWSPARVRTF